MAGLDDARAVPPGWPHPGSAAISRCATQIARAGTPMARRSGLWAMAAAIPWRAALTYWAAQGELLVQGETSVRAVRHPRQFNDMSMGIVAVVTVVVGLVAAVAVNPAAAFVVFVLAAPVLIDLPLRLPVLTKLEWHPNMAWDGADPVWARGAVPEGAFVYALVLSPGSQDDRHDVLQELSQSSALPVMVALLNRTSWNAPPG